MVYVRAKGGPPDCGDPPGKFTVQYFDEEGNMIIRSGGTRAWRCNNPGNLHVSKYSASKKRGCIGTVIDGKDEYAIYPDYATGHEALVVMLRGSVYSPRTLRNAMEHYEKEKKDYIDIIVQRTGLNPERTIQSLNDKEFESFWQAIEYVEKWIPGTEDPIEKWIISGVHKKKGVIFEYYVLFKERGTWVSKEEAIKLANNHKLHAVVVHLKNGKTYLRPEYGVKAFEMIA